MRSAWFCIAVAILLGVASAKAVSIAPGDIVLMDSTLRILQVCLMPPLRLPCSSLHHSAFGPFYFPTPTACDLRHCATVSLHCPCAVPLHMRHHMDCMRHEYHHFLQITAHKGACYQHNAHFSAS